MLGPNNAIIKNYNGNPSKGVWQYAGKIYLDHNEVIGHSINTEKLDIIKFLYLDHCKILYSLD